MKFFTDINKISTFRPIADFIDKASIIGLKNKGIIPIRVTLKAKKYLTKRAYEKNKGKWGTVIYIFEKIDKKENL